MSLWALLHGGFIAKLSDAPTNPWHADDTVAPLHGMEGHVAMGQAVHPNGQPAEPVGTVLAPEARRARAMAMLDGEAAHRIRMGVKVQPRGQDKPVRVAIDRHTLPVLALAVVASKGATLDTSRGRVAFEPLETAVLASAVLDYREAVMEARDKAAGMVAEDADADTSGVWPADAGTPGEEWKPEPGEGERPAIGEADPKEPGVLGVSEKGAKP